MTGFLDFKEVCRKVTIPTILDCINWQLEEKKHGEQWRGPCPLPDCEGDTSFVFTENVKGSGIAKFYCHSCRGSGDAVSLVHKINGHSNMKEAVHELAEFASMSATKEKSTVQGTVPEKSDEGDSPNHSALLEAVQNRLQPKHKDVQALGLSVETCEHFGAGYDARGAFTRGCLTVPIHDPSGELVAFCGIPLKGKVPLMKFPKNFDPERYIFNIHRMDAVGDMYMVEDVLGVLLSYENGIENAICRLTTTNENVVPFPVKQSA